MHPSKEPHSLKGTTLIKGTTLEGPKSKGAKDQGALTCHNATALAVGLPSHSRLLRLQRLQCRFYSLSLTQSREMDLVWGWEWMHSSIAAIGVLVA